MAKASNLTKFEWDLSALAKHDSDPVLGQSQIESQKAVDHFNQTWRDRTDYLTQPAVLRQALDQYEQLLRHHGIDGREAYYFHLRSAQDETDTTVKGLASKVDQLATNLANQLQFFTLNISKISSSQQTLFLADEQLQPYKHFLQRLFIESSHLLTEAEEKILSLTSQTSYDLWVRMTSSFLAKESRSVLDTKGKKAIKALPEILSLSSHQNKKIRDTAAVAIHQVMAEFQPVASEELNAIVTHQKVTDQLRDFDRPDASRHLSDDIDSKVVDSLLAAVSQRFDLSHRFYKLKAQLLNQPQLAYHERNVSYGDIDQEYTFVQAVGLVETVFQRLDPQFSQILMQFVKNRQIDIYPRPGKSGGAFCAGYLISLPTYILLNHTNRLQDVLTLAHEMGHGINNELMRDKQSALTFGTPLATAEVASTFMEDFVLEELTQQTSSAETKLAIMMMKLNDDISSIFRQVAAYQFEQELHQQIRQNGYLPGEQIGQLFQSHMAAYMGSAVEQSPGSQNWWVYWSHFRNFFYVYSYASGLLISKSLQAMVRKDKSAIAQVKTLLSTGTANSPDQTFKNIGLDITQPGFWQQGLTEIEELLNQAENLAQQLHHLPSKNSL